MQFFQLNSFEKFLSVILKPICCSFYYTISKIWGDKKGSKSKFLFLYLKSLRFSLPLKFPHESPSWTFQTYSTEWWLLLDRTITIFSRTGAGGSSCFIYWLYKSCDTDTWELPVWIGIYNKCGKIRISSPHDEQWSSIPGPVNFSVFI